MALDTLAAANGGTPAPLAGRDTAQGFVGAVMMVDPFGVEFSPASAGNQETGNDTLAEVSAKLDTLIGLVLAEDSPHVSGESGVLMLGVRQASDTTSTDADGDRTAFKFDEEGRSKVSTKPASYTPTAGNITSNGGIVWVNCSRASNIVFSMVATTLVGHASAFEVSNNTTNGTDGNWYGMQAVRSNAGTIETATGTLSATPAYGWEVSVNGWNAFRVRATLHTSGTAAYLMQPGSYATEPIPAAQVSATQPVSGAVTATVQPPAPATPYFLNSAGTTNGALVITGTSGLQAFYATNIGATAAFVKLYNKAGAPIVGTDTPEMIIYVPAAVAGVPGVATLPIGFSGFRFALGLGIAITGAVADSDTTAVAAGQVKVKLSRTV